MRTLLAVALIAALGAAGLGYAWHLLGRLPEREAAAPRAEPTAAEQSAERASELQRVAAGREPEAAAEAPAPRTPAGFEEGGAGTLRRDYAAIYAERTLEERREALVRLRTEVFVARQALGPAEVEELNGAPGNRPTTPGVVRLLALLEEVAWLKANLASAPAEGDGGGR